MKSNPTTKTTLLSLLIPYATLDTPRIQMMMAIVFSNFIPMNLNTKKRHLFQRKSAFIDLSSDCSLSDHVPETPATFGLVVGLGRFLWGLRALDPFPERRFAAWKDAFFPPRGSLLAEGLLGGGGGTVSNASSGCSQTRGFPRYSSMAGM